MKDVTLESLINFCKSEDEIDESKPINLVMTEEGLMEYRRKGPIKFMLPAEKIPMSKKASFKGVQIEKKIPISLLSQILAFFQAVYDEHKTECGATILYNKKSKEYRVHIPKMKLSGAHASWERDYVTTGDDIPIMEIHSHPWGSSASPSGTDDHDEQPNFGIFGVTGSIGNLIKIRATNKGKQVDIELGQLFDLPFPKEWLSQIEVDTYPTYVSWTEEEHKKWNEKWKQNYKGYGGRCLGYPYSSLDEFDYDPLTGLPLENAEKGKEKKRKQGHAFVEAVESMNREGIPTQGWDDFQYLDDKDITTGEKVDFLTEDLSDLLYADPERIKAVVELAKNWRKADDEAPI